MKVRFIGAGGWPEVEWDAVPRIGDCVRVRDMAGSPSLMWVADVVWDMAGSVQVYLTERRRR